MSVITLSSLEVLVDDILRYIDILLDDRYNGEDECNLILSNMLYAIHQLVYDLCCMKVNSTPLLTKTEVMQIKKAYKEEVEAKSDRHIVVKLSKLIILLKDVDPESSKVLISVITYAE